TARRRCAPSSIHWNSPRRNSFLIDRFFPNGPTTCQIEFRLIQLLQCPSTPFDIELRQPRDVREELGRRSARASGLIASAMGFVKQGQGHPTIQILDEAEFEAADAFYTVRLIRSHQPHQAFFFH
ncbi:hypothetical protein, partial [Burkholderia ubonensis]|uniref:hypothetical protein n=1 Tax=Burkholderia ubonensis TaxID=101571 RepID=UPI001E5CD1B6